MLHIKIKPNQKIVLQGKFGSFAKEAIIEAINFCKENKVSECDLEYFGFTMAIEPDSNADELTKEYNHWYLTREKIKNTNTRT